MKQSSRPFNNERGQHRVRTMHFLWPDGRGPFVIMVFLFRPWAATMTMWCIDQILFWTDPQLPDLHKCISKQIPSRLFRDGHAFGTTWRTLGRDASRGKFMKAIPLSGAVRNYSKGVGTLSWSRTSRTMIIAIRLRFFWKSFGPDRAQWTLPWPSRGLLLALRRSEYWSKPASIPLAPHRIDVTFTTMASWSLALVWVLPMATSSRLKAFLLLHQEVRVKKTAQCPSVVYVLPLSRLPRQIQPLVKNPLRSLREMRRQKNTLNWSISIDHESVLEDLHMFQPWSRLDQELGVRRFLQLGHPYAISPGTTPMFIAPFTWTTPRAMMSCSRLWSCPRTCLRLYIRFCLWFCIGKDMFYIRR